MVINKYTTFSELIYNINTEALNLKEQHPYAHLDFILSEVVSNVHYEYLISLMSQLLPNHELSLVLIRDDFTPLIIIIDGDTVIGFNGTISSQGLTTDRIDLAQYLDNDLLIRTDLTMNTSLEEFTNIIKEIDSEEERNAKMSYMILEDALEDYNLNISLIDFAKLYKETIEKAYELNKAKGKTLLVWAYNHNVDSPHKWVLTEYILDVLLEEFNKNGHTIDRESLRELMNIFGNISSKAFGKLLKD